MYQKYPPKMHSEKRDTPPDTRPDIAPLLNPVFGLAGGVIVGSGDAVVPVGGAVENVVDPLR